MKTIAIALLLSLVLVSCQKLADPVESGTSDLIGSWIDPQYSDTVITYSRAEHLAENQYGITFQSENQLIERQNSGFCGTPPIVTADYQGTWTSHDSIVNISVGFWGGTIDRSWRIISLDNHKLVISEIKSEYHTGK